jgi:hypothetical protein
VKIAPDASLAVADIVLPFSDIATEDHAREVDGSNIDHDEP